MWSVGLDVHQRTSTVRILDENGKVVKQIQVPGQGPRNDSWGFYRRVVVALFPD